MFPFKVKHLLIGILSIILFMLFLGSFAVIDPSERAIKVTLGDVSPEVYGPGTHAKWPIVSHFERVSSKPVAQDIVIEVGPKGAVSSDNQTIGLSAKVVWTYDTARVMQLVKQYPNRDVLESVIDSTAYEALKAEIGKYTIFELAKNAGKIATEAKVAAALKVKDYPVNITQVNLTNWDWSDDFDAQIKATMNAQQQVAKAKAVADQVEQQQRAQTITAEATAKSLVAKATGERDAAVLGAEARRAEGQGENDYNALMAKNMDVEIKLRQLNIERIRAERWNGAQVSQYIPLTAAGGIVNIP